MPRYTLAYKPSAVKALRRFRYRSKSGSWRQSTSCNPIRDGGDEFKLRGADDLWRIHIGDYRVIYTIDDDELLVLVVRVAHRRDAYVNNY